MLITHLWETFGEVTCSCALLRINVNVLFFIFTFTLGIVECLGFGRIGLG